MITGARLPVLDIDIVRAGKIHPESVDGNLFSVCSFPSVRTGTRSVCISHFAMNSTESPLPDSDVLDAMQKYADCEELKKIHKAALRKIAKDQKPHNVKLQVFMSTYNLSTLELPLGYVRERKEKDSIQLNMDVCGGYMDPETLVRMEKEQTIRKYTFSLLSPKLKKARIGSPMSTTE